MLCQPLIMTRKMFENPFARSCVVLINRSRDCRWHRMYSDSTGNLCFLLSVYVWSLCLGWSWLFMRVSLFGMGFKSKPMLTDFLSARIFGDMQFSNSTKVLGRFQNWLSKPRRKMPLFLCQRWWQGPCWVLGNVSASNDFHWPHTSYLLECGGVAFGSSRMLSTLGWLSLSSIPEPWFSHPHRSLGSALEKFC